jgi:hypothetical protein
MSLQEAKLLRQKDKKFDWAKLKKVKFIVFLIFIALQAD